MTGIEKLHQAHTALERDLERGCESPSFAQQSTACSCPEKTLVSLPPSVVWRRTAFEYAGGSASSQSLTCPRLGSQSARKHLQTFLNLLIIIALIVCIAILAGVDVRTRSGWKAVCANSASPTEGSKTPAGSVIGSAPAKETFTALEYRANWTNPNSAIPSLGFDVVDPVEPSLGNGHGWTLVLLHGLGAPNASHAYHWRDVLLSSFENPIRRESFGNLTGLRFIFPKAPIRPMTVYSEEENRGARPGWFDIKDWRDLNYLEDEESQRQSCIGIAAILKKEAIEGRLRMDRTIIAGFSQGAVMSLLLTLSLPEPPAAAILLSGYLALPFRLNNLRSLSPSAYHKTSLYWLHGTDDQVLSYNAARSGFQLFHSIFPRSFLRIKFKTLPGLGHAFNQDEEMIVANWIHGIVARRTGGAFDAEFDDFIQQENDRDDPRHQLFS